LHTAAELLGDLILCPRPALAYSQYHDLVSSLTSYTRRY